MTIPNGLGTIQKATRIVPEGFIAVFSDNPSAKQGQAGRLLPLYDTGYLRRLTHTKPRLTGGLWGNAIGMAVVAANRRGGTTASLWIGALVFSSAIVLAACKSSDDGSSKNKPERFDYDCWIDVSNDPRAGDKTEIRCGLDADKDGVINQNDICPLEEGRIELQGCEPGDCRIRSEWDEDNDGHETSDCGGDDCWDRNPEVHPGTTEVRGNRIDENCSGMEDGDQDDDGISTLEGDCQDEDPDIYPGASDPTGDLTDSACDGDLDDDGYSVKNGDCNDRDASIHPGAPDPQDDGLDFNCNGIGEGVGCPGSEYSSIQNAIDALTTGNIVNICAGTYRESIRIIEGKEASLIGTGNVIITGDGTDRPLTIVDGAYANPINVTFANGRSSSNGGGILVDGGRLSLVKSTVRDCEAENGGAVAVVNGGYALFSGVYFNNNRASVDGGALYVDESLVDVSYIAFDVLRNTRFSRNSAGERGGAVFISQGVLDGEGTSSDTGEFLLDLNSSPRGSAFFLESSGEATLRGVHITQGSPNAGVELGHPGSLLHMGNSSSYYPVESLMEGPLNSIQIFVNGTDESYSWSQFTSGTISCSYEEGICESE
ncbi:MAG: hypothetical protein HYY44_07375 [Deltaproteobacteria bacterium]|nr:hypothetical protein [Deltaproteobacteria bacterium]MBI4373545.1 hypothetical protein [Deltaproteobacteria bacterium]